MSDSIIKDIEESRSWKDNKKKWWKFHLANPHIYDVFDEQVRRDVEYLMGKGLLYIKKVRIRRIFENVKWSGISTQRKDGYVISNNYYKYYAFLWELNNPNYAGIFEHRGYIPKEIRILIANNTQKNMVEKYSKISKKPIVWQNA